MSRLLASDSLKAHRSQELLEFIVGQTLSSREDRLGAYSIGLDVFGRPQDWDPQTDPIVRVEASRLRRRLEHYYLTEGVDDPVLVEVPKGGYGPSFTYRDVAQRTTFAPTLDTGPVQPPGLSRGRIGAWALGLALVAVVVLGLFSARDLLWSGSGRGIERAEEASEERARTVVRPFAYATDSQPHPFIEDGLVGELIASLTALPDVQVLARGSGEKANDMTLEEISDSLQVDYVVDGEVRQERDHLRITVSVVDASNSLVRLSKSYDGRLDDVLGLQAEIAYDVAASMAATVTPAFGHRLMARGARDPEALALYHQATSLRDPPSDAVRSRLAEEAYRRVIELDPEFAGGYAGLAYVLAFRSWWGRSEQPEVDARKALEAARMAVEIDPEFGRGLMALAIALNVAGDHDAALEAAHRARLLSPSDPYVLSFSAIIQSFGGEADDSTVAVARTAIRLDPLSTRSPYRNLLGVVLFHLGRFEEALEALEENVELGGPDGPHMAYYRAGALVGLGRTEQARRELTKAEAFPYEFDIRDFLRAYRDPKETDELLGRLASLGFSPGVTTASAKGPAE